MVCCLKFNKNPSRNIKKSKLRNYIIKEAVAVLHGHMVSWP